MVNLSAIEGATPNPSVPTIAGYGIVWKGKVIPPVSGEYTFHVQSNDRSIIELLINGQVVYEVLANKTHLGNGKVHLNASDEAAIEVRFKHVITSYSIHYTKLYDSIALRLTTLEVSR